MCRKSISTLRDTKAICGLDLTQPWRRAPPFAPRTPSVCPTASPVRSGPVMRSLRVLAVRVMCFSDSLVGTSMALHQ